MKAKITGYGFLTVIIMTFTGLAFGYTAVPVSPGDAIEQNCPTFSWSAVENAAAYRIEVYEQISAAQTTQAQMQAIARPILMRNIAAPSLSWTPSSGECLARGLKYIWYVKGLAAENEGLWSEALAFQVEASQLSLEQKAAVQEIVTESLSGDAIKAVCCSRDAVAGSVNANLESSFLPMGSEGPNMTTYGTGAGATGTANSFYGVNAGAANTTGDYNTIIGKAAGYINTAGNNNVYLGFGAGRSGGGSGNIMIGFQAGFNEAGSNKLYIANSSTSRPLIWGDFSTSTLEVHGTLITDSVAGPSDLRYKKEVQVLQSSLEKVLQLQGVSYEWKTDEQPRGGFKEGRQIGLIAQEVEKVLPELVHTDEKGYKSVFYDKLPPVLLEAIKDQQATIEKQGKELKEKNERIEQLERRMEMIEMRLASMNSDRINTLAARR